MEKCNVCGKEGKHVVVCDNSCGTGFCSIECSDKDKHECGLECSYCYGMMIVVDNKWVCNYCIKKSQPQKPKNDADDDYMYELLIKKT